MEILLENRELSIHKYYNGTFFMDLIKGLYKKYPEHTFKRANRTEYINQGNGGVYSYLNLSIKNPENDKYIVVSAIDNWKNLFHENMGWKPDKMVKMFYSAGFNYLDYFTFKKHPRIKFPENMTQVYEPFFYGTYKSGFDNLLTELYENREIQHNKMYFRGWLQDFRKKMLSEFKSSDCQIIDVRAEGSKTLLYEDYLKEMSEYTCSLSLPGATEICNRDIESFAIGLPVIRPLLHTNYPDPLIPDYHYINCYSDCKYWAGTPYYENFAEVGRGAVVYWNKVKNNTEYLNFIAKNARDWYLRNCTMENNLNYVMSKLDLEILQ